MTRAHARVMVFISLIVLACLLQGCGESREILRVGSSESGALTARALAVSPAGGATVGFKYRVEVVRVRDNQVRVVFSSYRVEPMGLEWSGDSSLTIRVDPAEHAEYAWSERVSSGREVNVRVEAVQSDAQQ